MLGFRSKSSDRYKIMTPNYPNKYNPKPRTVKKYLSPIHMGGINRSHLTK